MCVVYETNEDSVLEVGEIVFMKLYICSGELHVSLTESGLWVSAAGVVAEKLARKASIYKCCYLRMKRDEGKCENTVLSFL